jgi:predicted dehydrogenase
MQPRIRVLVLGAGSAGDRHARHLASRGCDVFVADPDHARAAAVKAATAVRYDLGSLAAFDAVVVASPNSAHEEQALASVAAQRPTLVEKPIATSGAAAVRVASAGNDLLMTAYNLRLHAPVERLVGLVHEGRIGDVRSARLWFGSYLPAWRPYVDYRTTYSAQASLGGGILLDAIHELDLALWLVGDTVSVVASFVGRVGDLEIDVEDTVKCVLRTADFPVEISLDYLSRRYRRGIEVIGESATVRLDWARGVLEVEDERTVDVQDANVDVERSYERQADRFVAWVRDGTPPPVDGHVGAGSVVLADRIRVAAE